MPEIAPQLIDCLEHLMEPILLAIFTGVRTLQASLNFL